jgi:site-specific DNA-methyltransferase (adenine-specific)
VLDPFCGCGTAVAAAHKLGRVWLGIDITPLSMILQKQRLKTMFPGIAFEVVGEPKDMEGAEQLASDDRYKFQYWALGLIPGAFPYGAQPGSKEGKKGSDRGVDGIVTFFDDNSGKPKRAIVQVKSGKVDSQLIRELIGTVKQEDAVMGIFVTLRAPTSEMKLAAVKEGFYASPGWRQDYPKIQILTIEELLRGAQVKMPPQSELKRSQPVSVPIAAQGGLFDAAPDDEEE